MERTETKTKRQLLPVSVNSSLLFSPQLCGAASSPAMDTPEKTQVTSPLSKFEVIPCLSCSDLSDPFAFVNRVFGCFHSMHALVLGVLVG